MAWTTDKGFEIHPTKFDILFMMRSKIVYGMSKGSDPHYRLVEIVKVLVLNRGLKAKALDMKSRSESLLTAATARIDR